MAFINNILDVDLYCVIYKSDIFNLAKIINNKPNVDLHCFINISNMI